MPLLTALLAPLLLGASAAPAVVGDVLVERSLPLVDLAHEPARQVVVDREPGRYLGHPTTVLLEDGRTMLCVYPQGHGRGAIVYKRSTDGGRTWSERLPTPETWATSLETPTIHRVVDADRARRLILWSGLHPARLASSEDDGATWSELAPVGDWGGIVVMSSVVPLLEPGRLTAFFHDDGRFFAAEPARAQPTVMTLFASDSRDGGRTWGAPRELFASADVHLCEPGVIRAPASSGGTRLAMLLRENRRVKNSHVAFSDDDGATWTEPRELPAALSGDRHVGCFAPDGRLVISFRDNAAKGRESETQGDWVAWVGTFDDLVAGREGGYRVRLGDNTKGADCAYPGLEVLPDGTFVATTYGHWTAGEEPWILSVRFQLKELDGRAAALRGR